MSHFGPPTYVEVLGQMMLEDIGESFACVIKLYFGWLEHQIHCIML